MDFLRWAILGPMVVAGAGLDAVAADAPATKSVVYKKTTQRMDEFLVSIGYLEGKPAAGGKLTLEITAKKTQDRVEVETKEDTATLTLTSPSGIGTATISLKEGQWPHQVVLRLRLKGLESLTVSNGKVTLAASVSSHGDQGQRVYLKDGGQENPVGKNDRHWMEIKMIGGEKVPLKDGYFEMVLPEALFQGGPKALTVSWIDFYRA